MKISSAFMRYHFFLHYGWFLQNLEKDFIPTLLHTTVHSLICICYLLFLQGKSNRLWKYGQALWCSGLVQSTHCTAPSSLLYIVSNYGFRLRFLCLHVFVSVATFLPVFPKLVLQPYRFLIENYLPS